MVEEAYEGAQDRGREMLDQVKFAIIASEGGTAIQRMYPEWYTAEDTKIVVEDEDITEDDIEHSEGEWVFTHEDVTRDDIQEALAAMGQTMTVTDTDTARLRAPTMPQSEPDEDGWV
jgi:hypothetical protein